jgi:predicted transcriptional regulator
MLKISSSGVKERLRNLVNMGLMERHRVGTKGDVFLVRFIVSREGEKVLASSNNQR